ncbi:unnamed protein product [Pipistrellus nathusii]|uniref:Uncharacterized protein n=1 Tax=Pipistrellus nathusii TaxID=59473 RepID=A0ABN9Z7J1_PIPNA
MSTGQDHGTQQQRIFRNHQRLVPMSDQHPTLVWRPHSSAPPCSVIYRLLSTPMFHKHLLVVSACHSYRLFCCSAIWSICILGFYIYKDKGPLYSSMTSS